MSDDRTRGAGHVLTLEDCEALAMAAGMLRGIAILGAENLAVGDPDGFRARKFTQLARILADLAGVKLEDDD